ncbi:MAG TPA: glycosyltransferase [Blastocatellia bacterium]|nr:glycosyltransferase [Blastocatellia bacterium]
MSAGVSCLCLTYGRPALLEESIECFKRQSWRGPKELIIVNDHPDQELSCADEEIVIVNLRRRLRTLGEKRNLSVALAKYDLLLIWDDDDIYLPWRIEETMKYLPARQFFKSAAAWLFSDGRLRDEPVIENIEPLPTLDFSGGPRFRVTGPIDPREDPNLFLFHGGAAYTRSLYQEVRGYSCVNCGEDLDFENRLKLHPKLSAQFESTRLPRNRIYYVYRWRHGHYHASEVGAYEENRPPITQRFHELRPHWKMDYCAEVASRL